MYKTAGVSRDSGGDQVFVPDFLKQRFLHQIVARDMSAAALPSSPSRSRRRSIRLVTSRQARAAASTMSTLAPLPR